ncbi:MAG: hypothetical protein GY953_41980 [bacterium]|nr:hypothetical protein [bacterium]
MKLLAKIPIALRECKRCGQLVAVRYGVQDEHKTGGRICRPAGRGLRQPEKLQKR